MVRLFARQREHCEMVGQDRAALAYFTGQDASSRGAWLWFAATFQLG